MAYNYFPAGYQPYYPTQNNAYPTQMNVAPTQPTQQQINSNLIWVQGEAGAKSYLVAPNNTVQLWDSERQTIYLKSADASGMPSMKVLDYTIRDLGAQKAPKTDLIDSADTLSAYATKTELEALKREIRVLRDKVSGKTEEGVKDESFV